MSESWTNIHKLESYYSQLGKKHNFTVADGPHEMIMANVIQSFHDSFACIKCGPEYRRTCCDQLWYWSSVTNWVDNTVHQVHKNLIDVSETGKASVDNMEWVSSTCHQNILLKEVKFFKNI